MTENERWPHSPDPQRDVVLDAKGLRALAHPVRVQLIGLLRRGGPSTATRLAEQMGLTSGATSYHLRQLAAAGFVAEDAERGNARERWWRAVHQLTVWTDMELADEDPEAALGYLRSVVAAHTLTAQRALNGYETMPRAWRHALDLSDLELRLTPEETRSLTEELAAVVGRYRQADAEGAPAGAERVAVVLQVLPEPAGAADQGDVDRGDAAQGDAAPDGAAPDGAAPDGAERDGAADGPGGPGVRS
ncbi:winged helix-turn-helix domain-containing protein [Kitasatospora sp. NPDC050463]|uniref:ArsR/SmtB family transcription factor n=1 Tax=Kitasatospora sp. NPDC050463 TaxID=3155786 RepID=UPI0033E542F7